MEETIIVTPAYGRDYKKSEDAVKDWRDGKDFIIQNITSRWSGKPCSTRDFDDRQQIKIRYNRMADFTLLNN